VEIGRRNIVVAVGDCAYREVEGRFRGEEELGTEGAGVFPVCGSYFTFISAPISQVFVNAPREWEDVQLLQEAVLGHLVVRSWKRQRHAIPLAASDADTPMPAPPPLSERRDPGVGGQGGNGRRPVRMSTIDRRLDQDTEEDEEDGDLVAHPNPQMASRIADLKQRYREQEQMGNSNLGGRGSASREPPAEGRASGRGTGLGGGVEHGGAETQLMMMQVMEAMLEKLQKPQGEDAAEGNLDGLRVVKALSRLRELKTRMHQNPKAVYRAFKESWEEELGAEGKPWTWRDVSHHIPFGKFASIKRVHVLMGTVLGMLERGQTDLAMAQLCQNMKVLQEFTVSGSWELAWPHSYVVDPINPKRHGAREEELEAVSGYIRVQHDLETTTRKLGQGTEGQKATAEPNEH